jgi:hypothetical protein
MAVAATQQEPTMHPSNRPQKLTAATRTLAVAIVFFAALALFAYYRLLTHPHSGPDALALVASTGGLIAIIAGVVTRRLK